MCLPPEARRECPVWFFFIETPYIWSQCLRLSLIVEGYYNSGFEVFDKSNFWVSEELISMSHICENLKKKSQ